MTKQIPYKVLIVAPSLDIMGGQAVQADLLLKNLRADGVEIGFVPHNPRPPGLLFHLTRIKYLRTIVVSFFYLIRLFRKIPKYDIIHIFSASYFSFLLSPTPAILISRLFGKKIILNYRSGECRDHLERQGWIVIPIIRMASRLIVPSGYLANEFKDFGLTARHVYNLVDYSAFCFRERGRFYPRIIIARNLEKLYNIPVSMRAFQMVKEKYPEASLTIVGAGSEEASLKNFARESHLEDVVFTGRVERNNMAELYQKHDIFLNSSDIDNMPVSFLEAYACGLAVVSTNAGGIPYICENEMTGLLVQRGDSQGLARAIMRILEEDGLGQRLTIAAKRECAKYTWPMVGPEWHRIYLDLYHGKK